MSKHEYKYLLAQLTEESARFDKDSTAHKNMYRTFRYAVFILTAISTALASLAVLLPQWQRFISFIIIFTTATIGVISSLEGLRKPGELWIHERTTYYALRDLKREVEYLAGKQDFPEGFFDEYFGKMQAILGASGHKWTQQIVGSQNQEVNHQTLE